MDARIADIVVRLKEERVRQGLSVNKVYSMVEDAGEYSSLTTAKRIFAEGSERSGFKYDTLRPYIKVLFGTDSPTQAREEGNEEQAEEFRADLDNIKTVLQLKSQMLEASQLRIDTMTSRIEDLKSSNAFLRKFVFGLSIALGVVSVAFIAFLIAVDLSMLM